MTERADLSRVRVEAMAPSDVDSRERAHTINVSTSVIVGVALLGYIAYRLRGRGAELARNPIGEIIKALFNTPV